MRKSFVWVCEMGFSRHNLFVFIRLQQNRGRGWVCKEQNGGLSNEPCVPFAVLLISMADLLYEECAPRRRNNLQPPGTCGAADARFPLAGDSWFPTLTFWSVQGWGYPAGFAENEKRRIGVRRFPGLCETWGTQTPGRGQIWATCREPPCRLGAGQRFRRHKPGPKVMRHRRPREVCRTRELKLREGAICASV